MSGEQSIVVPNTVYTGRRIDRVLRKAGTVNDIRFCDGEKLPIAAICARI
jgi:hypothetical protein